MADVRRYLKTFLIAGSILGVVVHFVTRESMPWWPDTAIMGATFGTVAMLAVYSHERNRRTNQPIWNALKRAFARWSNRRRRTQTR
jgi:hypothetical protein